MQPKKRKLSEDVSLALADCKRFNETVEMTAERVPDGRQIPPHLVEARGLVMRIRKALPNTSHHDIDMLWKMIQRGI